MSEWRSDPCVLYLSWSTDGDEQASMWITIPPAQLAGCATLTRPDMIRHSISPSKTSRMYRFTDGYSYAIIMDYKDISHYQDEDDGAWRKAESEFWSQTDPRQLSMDFSGNDLPGFLAYLGTQGVDVGRVIQYDYNLGCKWVYEKGCDDE